MRRIRTGSATTALIVIALSLQSCRGSRSNDRGPAPAAADSLAAAQRMTEMQRWVDSAATALGIEAGRDTVGVRRTVTSTGALADAVIGDSTTKVFACRGGYQFSARVRGDTATLVVPDRELVLHRIPAPTGAAYAGAGYTLRSTPQAVTLDAPGQQYADCVRQPATKP